MSRENTNYGRDQFNIENARDIYVENQRSRKRPDKETKWLRAFEKEIAGRLTTSLHNQILINLGKEIELDQVRRLWDMEVKSGQINEAIAPETEILDVFDRADIQGKLLILGKPGSGKTTTLLELARSLVKKALVDPSAPMPILLNLSSWKDPRQSLKDWTIAELTTKGIGSKISAKWLEDQKFLPLFDGLDEVRSDLQPACVKAINQFLSGEGKPEAIVVCSRREEYELYSEKLDLNGAIYLQELSDAQIEAYLGKVDRPSLWEVLGADAALLELVRQPLLLSITLIAYRKELAERWQALQTTQARLEFLLDAYVERMLHRENNSQLYAGKKEPTAQQTRQWLVRLAKQLDRESETEFLIEKMQPTWLITTRQRWACMLIFGLIVVLIFGLISGLGVGLIFGLSVGLIFGLSVGLIFGLIVVLIGTSKAEPTTRTRPKQGMMGFAENTLILFGIYSIILFPVYLIIAFPIQNALFQLIRQFLSLSEIARFHASFLFLVIYMSFLESGGLAGVLHISLRLVLFFSHAIPWNYARFLNYATERMFLQRIGGRYRFIHKLLQEHFAKMEL